MATATLPKSAPAVEVQAAVIHVYRNGRYLTTLEQVREPKYAEQFAETYNRLNGDDYRAVVDLQTIAARPVAELIR